MKPIRSKEAKRNDCAVYVRHAWKAYRKPNYLFTDLEVTMGKGTIYALLGASGCGKTTLLSCIVGIRRLDSGEIWVLGGKPGTRGSGVPGKRVGYMPQELALYGDFSIKETMMYFGWIFGLKTKTIKETTHFLVDLLDLPPAKRLVRSLSGGQQRRVSLAVAVMHEPELLILDEPTVGVDPVLRANIWNYMVREVKERKTSIIITTHYIEEARQANTIGLMRDGQLLAEDSPSQLLSTYGGANLEDVFLKLARQQTASGQDKEKAVPDKKKVKKDESDSTQSSEGNQGSDEASPGCCWSFFYDLRHLMSCVRLRALLFRNVLRIVRNLQVLFLIFALPIVQVVLFCLCIGNEPRDLTVGIANDEVPYVSRRTIDCLHRLECSVKNNTPHLDDAENLSCRYLEYLNIHTLYLEYYPDSESCKEAVGNGEAWGCLHFEEDFTESLVFRMQNAMGKNHLSELYEGGMINPPISLENSNIEVWLDQSDHQIAYVLLRDLNEGFQNFTVDMLKDCHVHPDVVKPVVNFESPPIYGTDRPSFTDFAAPGVLLTIVFFLAVALTSSVLIIEKQEGLLERSYVAGVSPSEVLFSHVVTQFIIMVGQTILALVFLLAVFKVRCIGDLLLVVILTLLQGLCGMCFGFVISAICSQERDSIQLALGSFYPTLLLSGVIWPIEAMPTGLRYFALFLPLTLATTAMRSIMLRGWSFAWYDVYCGFIATCVWIVIFLIMSLLILKLKRS